jgi:hypothetical protein
MELTVGVPPTPYEAFLVQGDTMDGIDHRSNIGEFLQAGAS